MDRFDAGFFPARLPERRQALDPQHRLLLETSWEALEGAGLPPDSLMGSDTGVFVGLMYQDYGQMVAEPRGSRRPRRRRKCRQLRDRPDQLPPGPPGPQPHRRHRLLLVARRPCTLPVKSLRQGECAVALAGGVTLMLTPSPFVEFSRLRGLATDGRCKTFSSTADGTAWSEGCGMLVLERLSDARRNGHPVLAIIRGSAVNQDGRSNGLTSPNGPSQQAVIREALRRARVEPTDVGYVREMPRNGHSSR